MATQRQTEANRQNAQKSTGPRTAEGKARASLNALKSGIDSESLILPGEDPAALEALRAEYYDHHQPVNPEERDVLDCVIHAVCLLRRFRRIEAQLTTHEMENKPNLDSTAPLGHVFSDASHKFVYLQSRMNSAERSFHRNLDRLEKLEAQRPPLDEPEPEPAPPPNPAPEPPQPAETKSETPELASNPEIPDPWHKIPRWAHPAHPKDCHVCRNFGYIHERCPMIKKTHPDSGVPRPGHPTRLEDCPNCRNLGYISPGCHYVLKEPQE